jgi:hypothetical protein
MLALLPEAIPHLPAGTSAYDWYYYPFARRPRMELHNFREYDLAPALAARGIEYWGCPMNGSFRQEPLPAFGERLANIRSWWRRCAEVGAAGLLVTSWEPNRLTPALTTVVDAAAASLWLDPGSDDAPTLLARGFGRVFGKAGAAEAARAALACDARAFVGGARWEINERWDTSAGRSGTAALEAERRFFARLVRRGAGLPAPLRASGDFRLYLAERDVFVRRAAGAVLRMRRRLRLHGPQDKGFRRILRELTAESAAFRASTVRGARAASALWRLTRDPKVEGPNGRIVRADRLRLRALRLWLRRCAARPDAAFTGSVVCGAWMLRFESVLTEPALQRLVVETQGADGWTVLHARSLIEFRAAAARPRVYLRRESCVPVPDPAARLRIAVRGIGRVGIARIELTDGTTVLRPRDWPPARVRVLGEPAPAEGLPSLDWDTDQGNVDLRFDLVPPGQKKVARR